MADTVPSYQRLSGNIKPEHFFRLDQARFQMPFPESRSSLQDQQPKTGAAGTPGSSSTRCLLPVYHEATC
ncbi:hypothetical protein AOXY_G36876 [Acipenser oxyrinchus oxyrinchus]|uniref:Uncharacterized protein n=1 Tax=Acipenser oxyrinchus oxyrinchus TaxID=40147 RepID=A0AAD8CEF8_ACIOX|nr:hypothetical protein AOXY_G36876 [Acipenser oxyrinchus oxyrinchus]